MNKKDKVEIQLQLAEKDREIAKLEAENKELRDWYNEGTASNNLKADAIREMLNKCAAFAYNSATDKYDIATGTVSVKDAREYAEQLRRNK